MLTWFKRLIAGRELTELDMRRAMMDRQAQIFMDTTVVPAPPPQPSRDADFWDVAEGEERPLYMYGVTGYEDE